MSQGLGGFQKVAGFQPLIATQGFAVPQGLTASSRPFFPHSSPTVHVGAVVTGWKPVPL